MKERTRYIRKIPFTSENMKKYNIPEKFPCIEPRCQNRPAYIIIESDGLFTIIYGICGKHSKTMKPIFA
jgi:hypothetical protein